MTTDYGSAIIWLIVVAIGIGTYALRVSFVLLLGRVDDVPPAAAGLLRFVPSAVLAALVVPAILSLSVTPGPRLVFEPAKLLAGTLATAVAWRTENVLATIAVGMVTLWALGAVL